MLENSAEKHLGEKGGKVKNDLIKTWTRISLIQMRVKINGVSRRMWAVIERKRARLSN